MRVLFLLGILGLAVLSAACGGDTAPNEEQDAIAEPTVGARVAPAASASEQLAIGTLTVLLREANATRYAFGCAYEYDFTEGGWSAAAVADGLPVRSDSDTSWMQGETELVDGRFHVVTVLDMNSEATGATIFRRVDGDRRFCLVPK